MKQSCKSYSLGIITHVKSSDWAAPIVPVTKPDGSVRICGDYKLTINQAAHNPLPKIEDFLSALAGGVAFTKLDLAQAYLQLPLSDSSKQYVTVNTHKGLFEFNRVPLGSHRHQLFFNGAWIPYFKVVMVSLYT